jgi:hypothetical protein
MDSSQFDDLLRSFGSSRRSLLGGLALAAGWFGVTRVDARKKRRRKKTKKAKPNAFGCLEVGDPCKNASQCCSGVCAGKKCRAHDTGTCAQDQPGYCEVINPELATCIGGSGGNGVCFRTTAGSNVCINGYDCATCQRDADCEVLGYPAGSSCVPITGDQFCANLCETGMACAVFLDI